MSYDAGSQTATLDPTASLAATTTYTVLVKGGSAGVKDFAGNAMASDDSWTFTTRVRLATSRPLPGSGGRAVRQASRHDPGPAARAPGRPGRPLLTASPRACW